LPKLDRNILIAAGSATLLFLIIFVWLFVSSAATGPAEYVHTLTVNRGDTFDAVLATMHQTDIIKSKTKLRLAARFSGLRNKIKAGVYEIRGGTSALEILQQLSQGRVQLVRVTIPEGKHIRQIAAILQQTIAVDSTHFVAICYDTTFINNLGIPSTSLEGFLYPDTYLLASGMPPEDVVKNMVSEFVSNFGSDLQKRGSEMGFSIIETLTLASIIEGEAVLPSERKTISGVYHNRLKRGMRLQADPTIQYIIKDGPRRILNSDLEIDSPYNTYKYAGLPPGPINNPGREAIVASLYPEDVKYLYFVANGDGSHTFSRTLKEHLQAKARFDKHRRNVKGARTKKNG